MGLMQQRHRRRKARQLASRHQPTQSSTMDTNLALGPASCREIRLSHATNRPSSANAEASVESGRRESFRMLLRQRQLLADGVPVELGTRAFDLLMALLEADGSLVTKEELTSRVWPGIVVSEENLKVQMCALRKALGADRDVIRTEFGRGYRFTAVLRTDAGDNGGQYPNRQKLGSERTRFSPDAYRQSLPVRAIG
jgi:DNA-binding winged helix-turn-helix (wHTH) protein